MEMSHSKTPPLPPNLLVGVSLPDGDEGRIMVQLRVVSVTSQSGVQVVVVDDACLRLEMAEP